jgi:hypothetical protein
MHKYFFCKSPWLLPWKHRSTLTIWIWLSVSGKAMLVRMEWKLHLKPKNPTFKVRLFHNDAPVHPTEYSSWVESPTAIPHTCSCSNMELLQHSRCTALTTIYGVSWMQVRRRHLSESVNAGSHIAQLTKQSHKGVHECAEVHGSEWLLEKTLAWSSY